VNRPPGGRWREVQFVGGPLDGELTYYRGPGRPFGMRKFLDPALDPARGVRAGDLLHVYEFQASPDRREAYQYRGTELAPERAGS